MPPSLSPLSSEDIRETFNRALESEKGIRVRCKSSAEATNLRSRMNKWRKTDREASRLVYPEDDPRHGVSIYDRIIICKDRESSELRLEISSASRFDIEEL